MHLFSFSFLHFEQLTPGFVPFLEVTVLQCHSLYLAFLAYFTVLAWVRFPPKAFCFFFASFDYVFECSIRSSAGSGQGRVLADPKIVSITADFVFSSDY
jgi:hypothetical protein